MAKRPCAMDAGDELLLRVDIVRVDRGRLRFECDVRARHRPRGRCLVFGALALPFSIFGISHSRVVVAFSVTRGEARHREAERSHLPTVGNEPRCGEFPREWRLAMVDHHIGELIRDYGRSLLYGRHTAKIAKPPASRAFQRGVLAARMGMEGDANPYPFGTHAYIDWIDR